MEFLKQRISFKMPLLEHYFTSILKDLSTKNLVTFYELLAREIGKSQRRLAYNSKQASLGLTTSNKQSFPTT
jgi:hypothetical protein